MNVSLVDCHAWIGWAAKGWRPPSTRLRCQRPKGHDGSHRAGVYRWTIMRDDETPYHREDERP